jgi:hypothetical protein
MVDMTLEVVVVPGADVDRAKQFHTSLGWREDTDNVGDDDFRLVQMTPPGSACPPLPPLPRTPRRRETTDEDDRWTSRG